MKFVFAVMACLGLGGCAALVGAGVGGGTGFLIAGPPGAAIGAGAGAVGGVVASRVR
jgi:hypothetical protein